MNPNSNVDLNPQKQAAELIRSSKEVDLKDVMDGNSETAHDATNIDPFLSSQLRGEKKQSGLTRDELLKYADDPFWVRLRWATFILFWLVWLVLLVAAIVLIATAPRCETLEATLARSSENLFTVSRVGPLVELGESTWQEATERLTKLKGTHVVGVFLPCTMTQDVDIFSNTTHPTFENLQNFTATAKELNIKVIVDLRVYSVNTTHDWFERSERGEQPYSEYFVWANHTNAPPTDNKTTWPWAKSERREAYFLNETGAAVLNLANVQVREKLKEWLLRWVDAGAAGVRLVETNKLFTCHALPHLKLTDEHLNNTVGLAELLLAWRTALNTREAILTVADEVLSRGVDLASAVDFPPGADLRLMGDLTELTESMHLLDTNTTICPSVKVAMENYGLHPDMELMVGLMLPATPVFIWEQMASILGDDNGTMEKRKIYDSTMKIREEIQKRPQHKFDVFALEDTFVLSRWKDEHGYVTAVRQQTKHFTVNLTSLQPPLPQKLEAVVFSTDYYDEFTNINNPFANSTSLGMTNLCAIILKF